MFEILRKLKIKERLRGKNLFMEKKEEKKWREIVENGG